MYSFKSWPLYSKSSIVPGRFGKRHNRLTSCGKRHKYADSWLCSLGNVDAKLRQGGRCSSTIHLNNCQDYLVVVHDHVDFGNLNYYESKTVRPDNLNGEFLWKTKKLAVRITEASASKSKYNASGWSTEFSYFKSQKSNTIKKFATMNFPMSPNPFYYTSGLTFFDEDVKGKYTCTNDGAETWINEIKD